MTPHITKCADDSVLIEWIGKSERLGISFEHSPIEAAWYHVSRDGVNIMGMIPDSELGLLKEYFSKYPTVT